MSEQWKAIPGYEGVYEVSDQGRVRSVRRATNTYPGRVLKTSKNRREYHRVSLSKDGRTRTASVHRLVVIAFLGNRPEMEVNHIDGDKSNNKLENLEYVTRSENERHAHDKLGKVTIPPRFYGENHPQSVLTWKKVDHIRGLYETGKYSTRALGKMYGVSKTTIGHVVFQRTWRKVA